MTGVTHIFVFVVMVESTNRTHMNTHKLGFTERKSQIDWMRGDGMPYRMYPYIVIVLPEY